jgi:hypothetical protein
LPNYRSSKQSSGRAHALSITIEDGELTAITKKNILPIDALVLTIFAYKYLPIPVRGSIKHDHG